MDGESQEGNRLREKRMRLLLLPVLMAIISFCSRRCHAMIQITGSMRLSGRGVCVPDDDDDDGQTGDPDPGSRLNA